MIIIIQLKLLKDDNCVIYLTERTIKNIRLVSSKIEERLSIRIPMDIELTIEIENAIIYELQDEETGDDGETALPSEFNSVRDLILYAIIPFENTYSYLSGELEVTDDFTNAVSKFSFKNLFVTKFEERLSNRERYTHIHVVLRESER